MASTVTYKAASRKVWNYKSKVIYSNKVDLSALYEGRFT